MTIAARTHLDSFQAPALPSRERIIRRKNQSHIQVDRFLDLVARDRLPEIFLARQLTAVDRL
jgi:hypothetical protein